MEKFGQCKICGEDAVGYNILGSFCQKHKTFLVRDWSEQTIRKLVTEFKGEDLDKMRALFCEMIKEYPTKI